MKTTVKRLLGNTAALLGLNRRKADPLFLMLHRVLPQESYDKLQFQQMLAVTEGGLEKLIKFLKSRYTIIQLDDYLALDESTQKEERFVCLTFDDGWRDNFYHALPILCEHQVPASIYLSTGYIGTGKQFWWQTIGDALSNCEENADKIRHLHNIVREHIPDYQSPLHTDTLIAYTKRLRSEQRDAFTLALEAHCYSQDSHGLEWSHIKSMSDTDLIRFGTHTVNHVLLPQLTDENANVEITQCRNALLSRPDIRFNNIFCYPNGDVDDRVEQLVASAGYSAALATTAGRAASHAHRFRLPRVNVTEETARDPGLFNYRLLKSASHRRY